MTIRQHLKAIARALGRAALSTDAGRLALNGLYNRLGRRGVLAFVELLGAHPPLTPSLWRDEFQGRTITIPVTPAYPPSWSVALSSRWHEPELRRFTQRYIAARGAPGICFDVGANHGLFSFPLLSQGYRCVLFEPQVACNAFVRRVAELNGFRPMIEACVLTDREEHIEFFAATESWYSSVSRAAAEQFGASVAVQVEGQTLDGYCARSGLAPDLVKIDVEHHEWEVLRGARQTIERLRPTIVVEIWERSPHREELFTWLTGIGYRCFALDPALHIIPDLPALRRTSSINFVFSAEPAVLRGISGATTPTARPA